METDFLLKYHVDFVSNLKKKNDFFLAKGFSLKVKYYVDFVSNLENEVVVFFFGVLRA